MSSSPVHPVLFYNSMSKSYLHRKTHRLSFVFLYTSNLSCSRVLQHWMCCLIWASIMIRETTYSTIVWNWSMFVTPTVHRKLNPHWMLLLYRFLVRFSTVSLTPSPENNVNIWPGLKAWACHLQAGSVWPVTQPNPSYLLVDIDELLTSHQTQVIRSQCHGNESIEIKIYPNWPHVEV